MAVSESCMIEDCKKFVRLHCGALTLLCQNIRSINKNFDSLTTILHRSRTSWDFIILTECWLNNSPLLPLLHDYNSVATSQHGTQNEGVVIYYRSYLRVSVSEPLIQDANCLVLTLNTDTVVLAIYRSPAVRNVSLFLESLNDLLKSLSSYKNIILTGDFNIDISDNGTDLRSTEYLSMLAYHGMLPAFTIPTRNNSSCLDHLILKTKLRAYCYIANTSITDHDTVLLYLQTININSNTHKTQKVIKVFDYEKIGLDLAQTNFSPIYCTTDINVATNYFIKSLNSIIDKNVCLKSVPYRRRLRKPWMSLGLLKCLRNRDNLHLKLKKKPK